ncbi:ABC transporter permease, partial [Streptomyces sp. NPDC002082]
MTVTQTKTQPAAPDERVAKRSPFQKLLGRPEVGALVGAIVLFIFFALVSPTFTQPGRSGRATHRPGPHRAPAGPLRL